MAKDDQLRLMETLAFVPDLAGAGHENILTDLTRWVNSISAAEKSQFSRLMSVGSWYSWGTDTERRLRMARRAVLMAHARFGADVEARKPTVVAYSFEEAKAAFLALFGRGRPVRRLGECVMSTSFERYAPEDEYNWCVEACSEVPRRLASAVHALAKVRNDKAERARYVRLFGAYTERDLATVLGNFHKMYSSGKTIRLYYRGNGVTQARRPTEAVPPHAAEVAIIEAPRDAGYYARDARRDADPQYIHIFIGSRMFGETVRVTSIPGQCASRAAVIIHEMSHYLCATEDHFYGSVQCLARAAAGSRQVLSNASNYQWYVDQFA